MPEYQPQTGAIGTVPQDVNLRIPSREAAVFRRINTTMTGDISTSGIITIWDPTDGHRAILRGGELSAMFTTKGTGTGVDMLMLLDVGSSLSTQCIGTMGVFSRDAPAGQVICLNWRFDLLEGTPGSAKDSLIRIGANATIGSGVIRVTGQVWGAEVAQ